MKHIGRYTATNGENFVLEYIPENKNAIAIGPLPKPQPGGYGIGNRGEYVSVYAVLQEEAKEKLIKAIEEKIAQEK